MPDFKMSEIEQPAENPLRDFDDYEEYKPEPEQGTVEDYEDVAAYYNQPRKGSWFIGLVLFILIAAVAAAGYYGYTDLKQSQEIEKVYGSGELTKFEKKFEALIAENNLKLSQDLQNASQKQAELATQLASALKKTDGVVQELATSNKNYAELQKQYQELAAKHDQTVNDLATAQTKLNQLDMLNNELNKVSNELANAEARIKDLESTITTTANSLQAISQNNTKLSGQIETLAKQQTELSKNLTELVKTQADSGKNVATTANLRQLQAEIDKTNLEILKIKNLADLSVTKDLTTLKNEVGELKRKVDLLK